MLRIWGVSVPPIVLKQGSVDADPPENDDDESRPPKDRGVWKGHDPTLGVLAANEVGLNQRRFQLC